MLYALPTAIYVAVFFVVPLLLVVRMSAGNWTLLGGDRGLNFPKNFTAIGSNTLFWPAVAFTIEYTVIVTILLIGLGLGLALLVQESGRWSGFLRTSFLLPAAIGLATASLLFWGFYSPTIGPISPPLEKLGLIHEPIQFLGTSLSALLSTVFLIVWKYAGFYMLILLVGLQAIPSEVYEAAAIDGATRWQTLRRVTLPLLRPSLALALILCITGSLLAFDQGRAGQHDRHRRPADLPRGIPAPEPGHGGSPFDRRPGRAAGDQRGPVPRAAVRGQRLRPGPGCARRSPNARRSTS
jgi:multiple sugar transport system permease protein